MEKTYAYRRVLLIGNVVALAINVLVLLGGIRLVIEGYFYLLPFFLPFLLLAWWGVSMIRLVSVKITLREEDFVYWLSPKSKIVYRYEEIARLEPKSINFTAGWMNIVLVRGKTIRVTMSIKDCISLVRTLKEKLDGLDRRYCYDEDKLFAYYRTVAYGEISWRRMKSGWIPFFLGLILITGSTLYASILDGSRAPFVLMIASSVIGLIPLYYDEFFVFIKRAQEQEKNPEWKLDIGDPAEGKRRMIRCMLFFLGIQVIAGVLQFLLF